VIVFSLAFIALALVRRRQSVGRPARTLTMAAVATIIAVGALFSGYHFLFVQDLPLADWPSNPDVILPFLSNVTMDRTAW
jgi:hypothetical protein